MQKDDRRGRNIHCLHAAPFRAGHGNPEKISPSTGCGEKKYPRKRSRLTKFHWAVGDGKDALDAAAGSHLALRWESFELAPPAKTGEFKGAQPIRLSAVHALEEVDPSDGSPKLEWILLTRLDVSSRGEALRVLDRYRLRRRFENWHRILKYGCRAEYLNHQDGERIERTITIQAVIA